MSVYGWLEEESGREMLFLEELCRQVALLPSLSSLAVGIGKSVNDYIGLKSTELQTSADQAIA